MLPGGLPHRLDLLLNGGLLGADALKLDLLHRAQLLAVFAQRAQLAVERATLLTVLGDLGFQRLQLDAVHLVEKETT